MNNLVSIILPTFNGQKYIKQAIESCLSQTYSNFELIIIDDGSLDETPVIIKKYSEMDSRIKVITNKKNKGLPNSLNLGHRVSKGYYITWTSDDNYYQENAIENMVLLLENIKNISMTYSNYTIIDNKGEFIREVIVPPCSNLIERNCIGPCFLYTRKVYERTGNYSSKVTYAEDYDYWIRVAINFNLFPNNENLYFYREHSNSLSSTTNKKKIILAKNQALLRNLKLLPWLSTEEKVNIIIRIMKKTLKQNEYRQFLYSALIALIISPIHFMQRIISFIKKIKLNV